MKSMDYKYIEQLLERYWMCETSVQEEAILRSFFAQNDVPKHLQQYQSLFRLEHAVKQERLSEDFDRRVLALVGKQDTGAHVVQAKTIRMGYRFRPFFKAAGVVAIVLSFSMAVQQAMRPAKTNNVTQLPPQVVPGAPETAYGQNDDTKADSLAHLSEQKATAAGESKN